MKYILEIEVAENEKSFAEKFFKKFPERSVECYISEQNMVGVTVGFGTRGKVPFASTFACFFTRAFDQIRMAGISMANIKLVGSHVGVSIGELERTSQSRVRDARDDRDAATFDGE